MAFQYVTRKNLPALFARLDALRPETPRLWGSMTPESMLAHLRHMAEITNGKQTSEDRGTFFSRGPLRLLVMYVLPWPKGKIKTLPSFLPEPEGGLDGEREQLKAEIEEFVGRAESAPRERVLHAVFGRLTMKQWERLHGMHFDHHLRQFGV